ncbi:MAG: hypothetical protein ACOCV1_04390 [Bacillota bacterium]
MNIKKISGTVTPKEFKRIKDWFSKRFPSESFEEFAQKVQLRPKKR